jgi:hypothetical protein
MIGALFEDRSKSIVSTRNLLPAPSSGPIPTPPSNGIPPTPLSASDLAAGNYGVALNAYERASAPTNFVGNANPAIGSAGSAGLEGATANTQLAAANMVNLSSSMSGVKSFANSNPTLAKMLKFGLPVVGGYLFIKGHHVAGVAVAAPGALLWLAGV